MKINIKLFILFLSLANYAFTQTIYTYEPINVYSNRIEIDSFSTKIISELVFFNDSEFYQNNIFCNDEKVKIRQAPRRWYIFSQNKWVEFFNQDKLKKVNISLCGKMYELKWEKATPFFLPEGSYLLTLNVRGKFLSGIPSYYFHEKYGIVGIYGHDNVYLRNDMYKHSPQ